MVKFANLSVINGLVFVFSTTLLTSRAVEADDPAILQKEHCRELKDKTSKYCPVFRYCDWDHYDSTERSILDDIGYDETSWNTFSSGSYNYFLSYSDAIRENYEKLGYNETSFDYCLNHYESYYWSELYEEAQNAMTLFGYDENKWDNGIEVENSNKGWEELDLEVRQGLRWYLGYNRELWDGEAMPWNEEYFYYYPGETGIDSYYYETDAPTGCCEPGSLRKALKNFID